MRCCMNPKVIAGLALVAIGILVTSPHLFGAALPLLLGLICPLSMIGMVIAMSRQGGTQTRAQGSADTYRAELAALRSEVQRLRDLQGVPAQGAPNTR